MRELVADLRLDVLAVQNHQRGFAAAHDEMLQTSVARLDEVTQRLTEIESTLRALQHRADTREDAWREVTRDQTRVLCVLLQLFAQA